LDITQLHARLAERFGEAIAPLAAIEAGDPWIGVKAEAFGEVARFLRDDPEMKFDYLRLVSGVDWTDRISAVYHLYSYPLGHGVTLRVDLDRAAPRVASVAGLWPTADWHERETYDFYGVIFDGHPDLSRIMLPDGWEGHPLRKTEELGGVDTRYKGALVPPVDRRTSR
jgi:NADH-quinone oxidoreductase subunit C